MIATTNDAKFKMKTSTKQSSNFRPIIGKIVMAFALVSVMGSLSMTPAFSKDNESRAKDAQDRGRNDNRNRNDRRDQRAYRPAYQGSYRYSQPVYAPSPVYYPPQQSPGISLFFPLDLR